MRLHQFLFNAAKEEPDCVVLEACGRKIRFGELADEAKQVAAGLRQLGLRAGDSVAVMLPNVPEFVASLYGILLGGFTLVPVNVMLRGSEIEYVVTDSQIRAIIALDSYQEEIRAGIKGMLDPPHVIVVGEPLDKEQRYQELRVQVDDSFRPADTDPEKPIMTLYTSGTTGKPKGAQLTSRNVISNLQMVERVLPPQPDDKTLCVLPLFHVYALNGLLHAAIRGRTTLVLHPRFEVDACLLSLQEDGITTFAGVPTMYSQLLKHPEIHGAKFPRLRYCVSGGAPMPVEVLTQFEEICGAPIYEGYGLTETTVSVCLNRPQRRKVGSIGIPYDEVEVKIFDHQDKELPDGQVGELVIRGPNVMVGYLNKPEATAQATRKGWFHSGDLAYRDEDGFFFIIDRKKDTIIKGGFNIYPREIEELIYQLHEVSEAAVIGVFDEVKGELVRAVIAFKPGQSLSAAAIDQHLRRHLAKYKLPQDYVFVDQLPKSATGKILKRELRKESEGWNRDRLPVSGS